MLTRTVTYTDFDGVERTETYRFNLSKSELIEMELGREGRLTTALDRIVKAKDTPSLIKEFKWLILKAYGEKSADGKKFNKSDEISEAFSHTQAYDQIFMELVTDDEKAAAFINALIPADLAKEVENNPEYKSMIETTATDSPVTVVK